MFPAKTRILVVDDMSTMRMRIMNQLKSMGFQNIEEAENGKEAIEILEKKRHENQEIELIISDWNMPVMTGIDFLVKVRESDVFGKVPFVMVTAEGEKQQVIRALKNGVNDYLIKPIDKILLQQKLAGVWTKMNVSAS